MAKFVSCYRAPRSNAPMEYLAFMPPYDHGQFSAPEGEWFYTDVLANAFRFDTYAEAKDKTPTYDGSSGIEGRTGVMTMLEAGEVAPRDPWLTPIIIFTAIVVAYFLWQFFIR